MLRFFVALWLSIVLIFSLAWSETPAPLHLQAAQGLVERMAPAHTSYRHGPGSVVWGDVPQSHTDCSGFVVHLLAHCYGYDRSAFKRWLGKNRPNAAGFHDAVVSQRGFTHLSQIDELQPDDLLAVKYLRRTDNSGHLLIVAEKPQPMAAIKPIIQETRQWSVTVIDSSLSAHGPSDTRRGKGPNGGDIAGLGRGVMRLYTDRQGMVVGFSWSILPRSRFKLPQEEHLVMGRLQPDFRP